MRQKLTHVPRSFYFIYLCKKNKMKKLFVFLLAIVLTMPLSAQDKKMSEIKTSQLPKGVASWVSKNIPGGEITRAGTVVEKNVTTYVAVIESKGRKHSYLFDKDGKFLGKGDNLMQSQGKPAIQQAPPANTDPKQQVAPAPKPTAKPPASQPAKSGASEEAPKK